MKILRIHHRSHGLSLIELASGTFRVTWANADVDYPVADALNPRFDELETPSYDIALTAYRRLLNSLT